MTPELDEHMRDIPMYWEDCARDPEIEEIRSVDVTRSVVIRTDRDTPLSALELFCNYSDIEIEGIEIDDQD